jgi:hypothetical protein
MVKRKAVAVVIIAVTMVAGLSAPSASAARPGGGKGGGGGGGGTTSTPGAFVKAYSNLAGATQFSVTAEEVQASSDGGYIGVASTQANTSTRASVSAGC